MSTRKNAKLKRIIALVVNLQLAITPMAFAQQQQQLQQLQPTGFDKVASGIGMVQQVGGKAMQMMQQMQMDRMSRQQVAMMQNEYGLKPIDPSQVPPILSQNGCLVLPARPDYPGDMCESYDAMQAQSGYYTALMTVAENNVNDVKNFLTAGHQRFSTQGMGCYEKALKQFTAALNQRVEALNKLEDAINQEVTAFQKLAEKDVLDLKRGNALLEGTPKELIKDIQFEKKFSDPQCRSFMNGENFKSAGKGGFRSILKTLDKIVEDTPKRGVSAASFKGQQNQIKSEIRKMAKKIGTHVKKRKVLAVDPKKLGLRSRFFGGNNSTLAAILNEASTETTNELELLKQDLARSVENDADLNNMIKGIETDSIDLDNALYVYERKKKNACLNNYLKSNFGGIKGLVGKLQDPNISRKANRESDNALKNELSAILSNDNLTIEEKMQMVKKAESKKGNDRWSFTTGKSVSIEGKTIGASTRLRASDMMSVFTDNCSLRFEKERNSKGRSTRSALNMIKNYKTKFNNLQRSFATQLEEKVISEMINCPSEQTQGKGAGSCIGALNMDSGNFCLRTATTCASNMMACQDKANKMVETTRNEQKVIAQRYKKNMDQFKAKLSQTFMATNKVMESTARQLDGMYQFGSTYSIPVNLDLSLLTNKMMKDKGIDPSLMIEDPKEYQKIMKKNIAELKKSVQDQNNLILNGKGKTKGMVAANGAGTATKYKGLTGEIKKYSDNYKAQQKEWGKIAKNCSRLIEQHNKMIADQNAEEQKKAAESNQKIASVCEKVQSFNYDSSGYCGEATELGDEMFKISSLVGSNPKAVAQLKAFDKACKSFNSESDENYMDNTGATAARTIASKTPMEYCKEGENLKLPACASLDTRLKYFKNGAFKDICPAGMAFTDVADEIYAEWRKFVSYDKNGSAQPIKFLKTTDCETEKSSHIARIGNDNSAVCKVINEKEDKEKIKKDKLDQVDIMLAAQKNSSEKCLALDQLDSSHSIAQTAERVNTLIKREQKAQQYASIGQHIDVGFCNAGYDGQFGGKDFMNTMGQQQDRGLAGAGGWSQ